MPTNSSRLSLDGLHINDKLHFVEEPVEIMDCEVERLKQSRILIVNVRWNSRRGPEFTWEREDQFRHCYNDALTSKSDFLTEPTKSPQHIDEFNLKYETSLSECDEVDQNVLYFNDLFPFNIIYPDELKSDKDNDDDKIDIKHSSGGNVINTNDGAYA
ncbi:hypothetical protein Tco_0312368 [Tanacetum coccineum]